MCFVMGKKRRGVEMEVKRVRIDSVGSPPPPVWEPQCAWNRSE